MRRRLVVLVAAAIAIGGGALVKVRAVRVDLATTRDLHGVGFVGSEACEGCHEDRHRSWRRTFHRTMTAEATPASVLGRFDGATLESAGVRARMDRDGPAFRMTFTGGDGKERAVRVARTVGSHRYQQYLAKEGDTYWRLPVAWHVEEKRWFPMTGAFLFPDEARIELPGRPVFGGGVFDRHVTRWNDNCVFCHNVAPNPGLDRATGRFETTTAELGVACEACHGPGAAHVAANGDPLRSWLLRARGAADPTIVNPARLSPPRAADVCGRCHGQRMADDVAPFLTRGDPFVPGDDLALTTSPLWRDTALAGDSTAFAARFWGDGTPRLTAYEYQGLLQSRCAQEGALTCNTCHGMHEGDPRGQLRAGLRGAAADQMCTRCHDAYSGRAAAALHARHDVEGAGGRCVGCHMPRVVYGVLDVHRSHRIEIPDPARAARDGRPDACTSCHASESPAWAAAARARMWGVPSPASNGASHGPMDAAFAGDPVTRAIAVDALGRAQVPLGAEERSRRAGALLDVMADDDYPAVRHLAWRSLGRLAAPSDTPIAYDPAATGDARVAAVDRLRATLGTAAAPPRDDAAALRALEPSAGVEIGE